MRSDPADRLFNDAELKETFLRLRKIIKVDFEYKIDPKLDKSRLRRELIDKLTKTKQMKKYVSKRLAANFWKETTELEIKTVNDIAVQTGYLRLLLQNLE